jgi:hypothetical protein
VADVVFWNVLTVEPRLHKYPVIGQFCKDIAVKTARKSRLLMPSALPGAAPENGPPAVMDRRG